MTQQHYTSPRGYTDKMKRNNRYNSLLPEQGGRKALSSLRSGVGKVLLTLCLMLASVGAWAQQYVFISNETNGYFLKLTENTTVGANQTYDPATCVWTASNTLSSTNTNYTFRINNGQNRYLYGTNNNNTGNLVANTATTYANFRYNNNRYILFRSGNGNNRSVYRNGANVAYVNNNNTTANAFRYYTVSGPSTEAFTVANITGINNTVTATGTYNLTSAASYTPAYYTFTGADTRYYAEGYTTGAVTTRPAAKTTGFTSETWTLNKTIPGLSISNTGVLTYNTYVTEDTQVTITHTVRENGQTKTATRTVTLEGTIVTSLAFASTNLNMTSTTLSLPAVNLTASNGSTPPGSVTYSSSNTGCVNVSNTGVLTINGAGTATITANYAANGDYLASSATMTITVANTAALDETVLGDMTITPSSNTLDLGQQVTYTASPTISSTHRTRPAYSTITTSGNNYYKVGANYQAAAPNTNEDSTPVRFTSFNWSAAEGGAYFTLDPYYSATSNQVTLTRTEQKTGTQQTFTISVTGVYAGQNKTASATVTIPKTQVNPTALHPEPANFTLGVGANATIAYTAEPNYDAAGETYLNITFTSNNTSIATVSPEGLITAVAEGNATITLQAIGLDGNPISGVTATVTVTVMQGTGDDPNNPYYVADVSGLAYMAAHPSYHFVIASDFSASGNTSIDNFSGTLDGGYYTISGLTSALFDNINGGTVKNVRLDGVNVSSSARAVGDAGTIANTATGNTKIYNCGVLSGSVSGSGAVGGIVGRINGQTKVVNCYNYAGISGGQYAAGVVGYNGTAGATPVSYTEELTPNDGAAPTLWSKTATNNTTAGSWTVNKHSNENDASGIVRPFYEIWRAQNNALGGTITCTRNAITALPNGQYEVTLRIRLNNEAGRLNGGAYPDGSRVSFTINGTNIPIQWQQAEAGTSRITYTYITTIVNITNGQLNAVLTATNPTNTSWIAFNGFTYRQMIDDTMIANCVNYGTEVSGSNKYPVYGGNDLDNKKNPLYDFFLYDGATYRESIASTNGALPAEARFLNRFEYVRATLNAEKKLAAYHLFGTQNKTDQDEIGKWVLDTEIAPYPIIKPWGKYPSLVNPDVSNRSVGTLSVNISGYGSVSLPISDQYEEEFDYGYHKVQLPYYNDYFNDNYKANSVVTGWKITSVSGGTAGSFTKTGNNAYNFADRNCTQKDLFSVSGRVFAQGGYYYVPEGVTGITIEPYWANDVVYLYDPNIDKVFGMGYSESNYGPTYQPTFTPPAGAKVRNTLRDAHDALTASVNVYDHAIVLIGNVNFRYNGTPLNNYDTKGYTIMSIDEDHDNEPDYAEIYGHVDRRPVPPTRLDFVHQVGISWVKKPMGETLQSYSGIPLTRGHFEITETAFARFTEFETGTHINRGPLIFNAGLIDQFVTNRDSDNPNIDYAILGGHTYFNAYTPGCQPNSTRKTTLWPTSVTGGEYAEFYLTGMKAEVNVDPQNGRVYTNGGKMGTFAGAYWEQLKGDVYIRFDHTQVKEFYGGGINPAKPITGNIDIIINNSDVEFFCAGPKAGNMTEGKTVTTVANNDKFGTYVGAGYGGSSVARFQRQENVNGNDYMYYKNTFFNNYFNADYLKFVNDRGILIRYAIEYMPGSGGMGGSLNPTHVTRFYDDYAQLSLARTYNVTSTLNGCEITANFYGGPWSGTVGTNAVEAHVESTLTNCTVQGSVFGGGKSAEIPTITVYPKEANALKDPLYNGQFGMYYQEGEDTFPVYPQGTEYTWVAGAAQGDPTNHTLGTSEDLTNLGTIFGNTQLTIDGGAIAGNVFGAGDASKVTGNTSVLVKNNAIINNVYGAGNEANLGGDTDVDITGGTMQNVFGGGNLADCSNTNVDVTGGAVSTAVYGGGALANVTGNTVVNLFGGSVNNAFGGGLGRQADDEHGITAVPAEVGGNTLVTLNGSIVTGSIFGANNLNGTPLGHAKVHVLATRSKGTDGEQYHVPAVYGGGNQSAYEPTAANDFAEVIVENCDNSIEYVYGGGNAAPVPATQVTIWGADAIGNVFGGGNGKTELGQPENPGANVGVKADNSTAYGAGTTTVNIYGGTIHSVFGGSNTKGLIRVSADVNLEEQAQDGKEQCPLFLDEVYAAGNEAEMYGASRLNLGCITGLEVIYGGAKNADFHGDVVLNITSGRFGKVFGGNNLGGTLDGSITVNIDEIGCHPLIIDELYACGNLADYTTPNDKSEPTINIISCTRIGQIFGAGFGDVNREFDVPKATVTGNPIVNINQIPGRYADQIDANGDGNPDNDATRLGEIGVVFGGGNAAKVVGSTTVNVGTATTKVKHLNAATNDEGEDAGANITGNVYGGGNQADVTGKTNVTVGPDLQ